MAETEEGGEGTTSTPTRAAISGGEPSTSEAPPTRAPGQRRLADPGGVQTFTMDSGMIERDVRMNAADREPRPADLMREQERTLESARRPYGLLARLLFVTMDLFYTRKRSLRKFKVLEVVARVPYQAWESVAYVALIHMYQTPDFARRIFDFVAEARHQQDNEQWHLLIIEELLQRKGIKNGFFRFRLIPQILALTFYWVSWTPYVIRPSLSYRLNADFEDHAEHEYMEFVQENPNFDQEHWESSFAADYGEYQSLGDLLRRIGVDERHHKQQSVARIERARFA